MLYILSLVVQQIGTNFGEAIKLFLSGSISLVHPNFAAFYTRNRYKLFDMKTMLGTAKNY